MSLFFKTDVATEINGYNPSLKNRSVFLDVQTKTPNFEKIEDGIKYKNYTGYPPVKKDAFEENPSNGNSVRIKNRNMEIVYQNSRPIYMVLKAFGIFPFQINNGIATFSFFSPNFLYSIMFFLVIMAGIVYVLLHRIKIIQTLEGKFEEAVIAYLFIVNILPVIIIPLMWYECHKVANVLNSWTEFEKLYYKVTQTPLALTLKRKALMISIILPILSSVSVIVTHVTMVDFRLDQVIPYCFLDTMTYMMGAYWFLCCETLSQSAHLLANDFQKALRHIGPAKMISDYRALWLRLSKLARDTGFSVCYTFTFITLYLFVIITLTIYGLMSQISNGFGVKDIGLVVTAMCSICLLFFICDEAHYASHSICTNFQKKLLIVELSWMNTDAQTEINMFLRATEMNPSRINLGGFFDVNRNLFKSLLATMVTYLVVLLQFQISIPDDPNQLIAAANSTFVAQNKTLQQPMLTKGPKAN
uniref:Gustatory receptor n=1 Tax=Culicoides sonorensis TaxID=179676 RepID=A0A336LIB2_CULSO